MSLEIELKFLLDGEDAATQLENHLLRLGLASSRPTLQLNHYFDTAGGDLREGQCALRLRLEGDRHLLTAKGSSDAPSCEGAMVQQETEALISASESGKILVGQACPLEVLQSATEASESDFLARLERLRRGTPLTLAGRFSNLRTTFGPWTLPSGTTVYLELDRTDFGSRTDFELEAEVTREGAREARLELEQLLSTAGVEWQPATSKARRFFELKR